MLNGKMEDDHEENSFLHKPSESNKVAVVKALLESGFNPNLKNIVFWWIDQF